MTPWLSVVLFGVAVFGFSWLSPGRPRDDRAEGGSDPAYDRLLEDLESENRELLDAVAKFKQEQDDKVKGLVKQIVELEHQMKSVAEQSAAAAAAATAASAQPVPAPAAQMSAQAVAEPAQPPAAPEPAPSVTVEARMEEEALQPTSIRVRYAELLALHDKGRSVEQIAKTAGMNKGEVQLILQLARREEEQLA
ncbi:DUF6115 domain-containing protein [Cohnella candidum]|uniref:DUF2802 domain-containing protein n=1 Tax=Cohnella candidum TaxID=2674991 RepID=A0A3G3JUT3_9BACL|nr:hypothetical protein [Cohnella candidum]AYQ72008.1 hypothetical protein EAV92_05150 [Cohnella candidum]